MLQRDSKLGIEWTPHFGKKSIDSDDFLEQVKTTSSPSSKGDLDFSQCLARTCLDGDEILRKTCNDRINHSLKNLVVSLEHALIKVVYASSPSNESKRYIDHAIQRPGVELFLDSAKKDFNVSILTQLPLKTFESLFKKLDLENYICDCYLMKSNSPEQEARFLQEFDLSKTIFLQDDTKTIRIPEENLLSTKLFTGSDADTELIDVLPFLAFISKERKTTSVSVHKSLFSKSIQDQEHTKDKTCKPEMQDKSSITNSQSEQEFGIHSSNLIKMNLSETSVAILKNRILKSNLAKSFAIGKENNTDIKESEISFFKEKSTSPDSTPKSAIKLDINKIRAKLR